MSGRTTAGLLGDALAGEPGTRFGVRRLTVLLGRHRTGVLDAAQVLKKADAINCEPDPEDRRRNVYYMTPDQAKTWTDSVRANATRIGGIALVPSDQNAKAAAASSEQAKARRAALRFGVMDDGAIIVQGLTRKQITVPSDDARTLAELFAAFPEGALQRLCASALRPVFALTVEGRAHPLTADQTAQLVAYVEDLPARALRSGKPAAGDPFAGLRPGTDHRVHLLADDDEVGS